MRTLKALLEWRRCFEDVVMRLSCISFEQYILVGDIYVWSHEERISAIWYSQWVSCYFMCIIEEGVPTRRRKRITVLACTFMKASDVSSYLHTSFIHTSVLFARILYKQFAISLFARKLRKLSICILRLSMIPSDTCIPLIVIRTLLQTCTKARKRLESYKH